MIFRRETRGDAFHRQIASLRQQLEESASPSETNVPAPLGESDDTSFSLDIPPEAFTPARPIGGRVAPADVEPSAQPGRMPALTDAAATVLSAHDHWEGTLRSQGSVTIRGRLEGQVHATKDVTIDEGAEVEAEIFAHNVLIHGTVRGRVEANGRLEVFPTGKVIGDVKAPSLVIHEGAKLSGQLRMDRGGEPSRPDSSS